MDIPELVSRLRRSVVVQLTQEELAQLQSSAAPMFEREHRESGPQAEIQRSWLERPVLSNKVIRIFSLATPSGEVLIVQETSTRNEILVRLVQSMADADHFIEERRAAYERMWDG